ncbi:MAG: hypothetical protein QM743_07805 [Chitinophagaceae bacterium]
MKKVIFGLMLLGSVMAGTQADAQGRGHGRGRGNGHRRPANVTVIQTLPPGARVYHYQGADYHYVSGRYYRQGPSGYTVIGAPPVGFEVDFVPTGYQRRVYQGVPYYYSGNVYYRESRPNVYVVVGRPW